MRNCPNTSLSDKERIVVVGFVEEGIDGFIGVGVVVEVVELDVQASPPHIYLVMVGDKTTSDGLLLAEQLRESIPGLRVQANLGGGSFKSQFKRADRSAAHLAFILGEEEVQNKLVSIKHLRSDGAQESVAQDKLQLWLEDWLTTL